jgi:hypothetical protein
MGSFLPQQMHWVKLSLDNLQSKNWSKCMGHKMLHHWMIKSQFLVLLKIWWNMYLWCQVHLSFDLRTAHHFHNHYLYHDHVHVHHLWWSFNGKKHVHYHHDKISRLSISSTRTTRTTSNDRNDRNDPDRSLPVGRRPVTSKRNRFTLW